MSLIFKICNIGLANKLSQPFTLVIEYSRHGDMRLDNDNILENLNSIMDAGVTEKLSSVSIMATSSFFWEMPQWYEGTPKMVFQLNVVAAQHTG